jgi:hypothetical protein
MDSPWWIWDEENCEVVAEMVGCPVVCLFGELKDGIDGDGVGWEMDLHRITKKKSPGHVTGSSKGAVSFCEL